MITRWMPILPALALVIGAHAADAQSLRNTDGPAEIPPASYTGRQYVDSNGCVFVRAGFEGNVQWIPRVSRDRTVLCGFTPSGVAGATPPAQAAPAPTPVPVPAPVPVRSLRTAPPVQVQPAAPAPARATMPAPPAPAQQMVPAGTGTACPGMSGVSAAYMQARPGMPVRCGPQAAHPVHGSLQITPAPGLRVPDGYRPVFEDGRLNPLRGVQTLEGNLQMSLVWTQTVPRRLINPVTGRDVSALYPGLQYPYTTLAEQRAAAADTPRRTITLPNGNTVRLRVAQSGTAAVAADTRISTKSVGPEAATRYVQAASFGSAGEAEAAAAQLRAMGLPVRMGRGQSSGNSIVLVGPFADATAEAALAQLQGAGYARAFLR